MSVYSIKRVQVLPITLEQAWEFFSTPDNLRVITPPDMGFEVRSDSAFHAHIYAGQIISYRVRPLLNIPVFWMTEITHVEPLKLFVDEQRIGPYRLWHHQHHFREVPGGVEMTDLVHYQLPFGWLGRLVHGWVVAPRLRAIFAFRSETLERMFGKPVLLV